MLIKLELSQRFSKHTSPFLPHSNQTPPIPPSSPVLAFSFVTDIFEAQHLIFFIFAWMKSRTSKGNLAVMQPRLLNETGFTEGFWNVHPSNTMF